MECTIEISGHHYALEYLAEGAANIVYKLRPSYPDLLRLRKTRSSTPYNEIVHKFKTVVAPLFPDDVLIHPRLIRLPDAEVMTFKLNRALCEKEAAGSRQKMRRGVYLATDEEHGICVQSMTPRSEKERFIEFKPKWLIQSPSAPAKARRCRTCALREMRQARNEVSGRGDAGFCPLDLLSTEKGVLEDIISLLVGDDLGLVEGVFRTKVQPLLYHLRTLQTENNRVGLAEIDSKHISAPSDMEVDRNQTGSAACLLSDILIGMTIRDCSVFIRYDVGESESKAEVKLADLDMKSAKLEKWADTERQLINGGWYTGTEEFAGERGRRYCRALQSS